MSDFLAHVGTPHEGMIPHSGRYAWGSGENPSLAKWNGSTVNNPYDNFISTVAALRKKYGSNDEAICRELYFLGWEKIQSRQTKRLEGESDEEYKIRANMMSTGDLRARLSAAKNQEKLSNINAIERMRAHGDTDTEIARKLGLAGESSVRALMKESVIAKNEYIEATTNEIISKIDEYGYIDVGKGISNRLGISDTQLRACVAAAIDKEGYKLQYFEVPQAGNPAQKTSMKILSKEDIPWKEINNNLGEVYNFAETGARTEDQGRTWQNMRYPQSISSDRISIRYGDEGGSAMDGVIQIRPGVADLSLGESKYAQVRIAVDDKMYLKGMALYSDEMPAGKDIIFNTNKVSGTPMEKVLKPFETKKEKGVEVIDRDNPFGAALKKDVGQHDYIDPKTGETKLSAINIVREEGDWTKWTKTISAQMLSKQNVSLAKRQLELTYNDNLTEFESIKQITNPTVKKKLLMDFAEECDSQASTLTAKGFPNQAWHTLLPLPNIKSNECYCPNYQTGTDVILIRYPHGGKFEIPSLTVNNNDKSGKKILGNVRDAIGISPETASQMSGADFDGDTALVIPNPWVDKKTGKISKTPTGTKLFDTESPRASLKTFDPHKEYAGYEGMPVIKERTKQLEMGVATNLLTDMGVQGAKPDEIVRAIKYTMVVIDAKKHKLDYKRARDELQIQELKKKYQAHLEDDGKIHYGASSIVSRSDSETKVNKRQFIGIDPDTGEKKYRYTGDTYISKKGDLAFSTQASTRMKETKDAFTLVYRDLEGNTTPMESTYATHANKMKALANEARKEYIKTPNLEYSPSAYKRYEPIVKQLKAELSLAESNSPAERKAHALVNQWMKEYKADNPGLTKEEYKKKQGLALTEARARTGAKKHKITITDEKFEAIQAGAIHDSTLQKILNNTDMDVIRQKSMPSARGKLTASQIRRIKALLNSGYDLTYAEIAKDMNVSVSTIQNVVSDM